MTWLARTIWLYAIIVSLASMLLGVLVPGIYDDVSGGAEGAEVEGAFLFATIGVVGAAYATAGILILRHRVRHAVGWILLVAGAFLPSEFLAFALGGRWAQQNDPVGIWLALLSAALFWPMILLIGPGVALVFPDGRLPAPAWRWPIRVGGGVVALATLALLVRPGSIDIENGLPANPIGLESIPPVAFEVLEATGFIVALLAVVVAVGSIVVRYRRAAADERLQLRWFVFAVAIWCLLFPISLFSESVILAAVALGALVLLPISILIAITRYRLYEIDTLINRTLVYVPLVGIVAGLYAACLALLQRLFVAFTGNTSDGAAVISALILAAVFTPIRKAIEGFVDQRFKPAAGQATPVPIAGVSPDDPAFAAAVESVVRRVLAEGSTGPDPRRTPVAAAVDSGPGAIAPQAAGETGS